MINQFLSSHTINIYALLVLFSAGLSLTNALFASVRTHTLGGRSLVLINSALFIWSFFSAMNYFSRDFAEKILWNKLAYVGVVTLPVFVLMIALEYYRSGAWLDWKKMLPVMVIPLLTLSLVWTSEYHTMVYTSIKFSDSNPALQTSYGWFFWVGVVGYSYLLIMLAVGILIRAAWEASGRQRSQIVLLVFSILIPVCGNLLYIFIRPRVRIDLTPILFSFTNALLVLGIVRFQLLDIVPIAFNQVVESMGDNLLVLDKVGRLVYMNPSAVRTFGQEGKFQSGQPVALALPALAELVEQKKPNGGQPQSINLVNSGLMRQYNVEVSPLLDSRRLPGGQVILLHDITTLKQAQEAVQRSAIIEERERIARELHDNLGQVLSYLQLNTQAIRDHIEGGNYTAALGQLHSLSLIAQSANQDVRQYILDSRTNEQDVRLFSEVLKEYLIHFESITGLKVQLSLPEESIDSILSQVGYFSLLRIIQEALANTRKHAQARQAQVIFSVYENLLGVIISDDGVGFDPRVAQSGFGLDIIHKRAVQAGAEIEIRSAAGKGTQIVLKIPINRVRPAITTLVGLKVLVVDDHPLFAEGIMNLLTGRGLDVVGIARTGEEAIRLASTLKPDLILLDVNLPDQKGYRVIQPIRQYTPLSKVVMISLEVGDEVLLESMQAGANGFLLKNQPTEEFFQALAGIMRGETQLAPGLAGQMANSLRFVKFGGDQAGRAVQILQAAGLSLQQIEILALIGRRKLYKEIATELSLSESAIKYHSERIQAMLKVTSRAELVLYAKKIGLVGGESVS